MKVVVTAAHGTQFADQPLVQNQFRRGSNGGMVGAHHEQPLENAPARPGVQRGNHQMPGQSGPHRQLRGGFIANLADDERLRVLP